MLRGMFRVWGLASGLAGGLLWSQAWAAEGPGNPEWFPFAIPGDDAAATATDFSSLNPRPAGALGFVQIRDGHFYTGDRRLRLWGVNVCFGANFPSHAEAEQAARHLAKLGVNVVRFHHHDNQNAPGGIWRTLPDGKRELDPAQLERQDYFLDQLHRHGIYANLNLHVSRTFTEAEGFVAKGLPPEMNYNKYVIYFDPRMRTLFKQYCRDYLLHENPYRQLRRIADPGIAVLEITNENRFSAASPDLVAKLPAPYLAELVRQWRAWLPTQYSSTPGLRAAWAPPAADAPGEILADGGKIGTALGKWVLNAAGGQVEPVFGQPGPNPETPALQLHIKSPSGKSFEQELQFHGLSLEKDRAYTLSFWARAARPRRLYVDVSNSGPDDWRSLGYVESLDLKTDWVEIRRPFRARETVTGNVRVCLKFGGEAPDVYLAGLQLQRGAIVTGLPDGQSLETGNIDFPGPGSSAVAQADARRFQVAIETEFIQDLKTFLQKELGAKVPITASQIDYHGAAIVAATCDFADAHAYWDHPSFPDRAWDMKNWHIRNQPLEPGAGTDPLSRLAAWRLLDRPFTVSEWNIPNPSDYAASVVPFASVVAALQDWDGVYFFDYHASHGDWLSQGPRNFFSFSGQPAKQALLGLGAQLYLRGDLAPLSALAAGTCDNRQPAALALDHRLGIDPKLAAASDLPTPPGKRLASPGESVVWDATDAAKARVLVNVPATRALFGLVADSEATLGALRVKVGAVDRQYAVLLLSSLDGKPVEESRRLLLAAVGRAENPGMGWNAGRTSVGNRWGKGPAQVNGIPAEFTLPLPVQAIYPLDGCGQRGSQQVPVRREGQVSTWKIGPEYRTLWYEIVAE